MATVFISYISLSITNKTQVTNSWTSHFAYDGRLKEYVIDMIYSISCNPIYSIKQYNIIYYSVDHEKETKKNELK